MNTNHQLNIPLHKYNSQSTVKLITLSQNPVMFKLIKGLFCFDEKHVPEVQSGLIDPGVKNSKNCIINPLMI